MALTASGFWLGTRTFAAGTATLAPHSMVACTKKSSAEENSKKILKFTLALYKEDRHQEENTNKGCLTSSTINLSGDAQYQARPQTLGACRDGKGLDGADHEDQPDQQRDGRTT